MMIMMAIQTVDSFPFNSTEWVDTDSDGIGNNMDLDDDNDGFNDTEDAFPLDPLNGTILMETVSVQMKTPMMMVMAYSI